MWECALELVDDCTQSALFDPPELIDGEPACISCAREAKRRSAEAEIDYPYKLTD